jgi:FKBP-type peptidyl-prolyl cis-trans isomerase
VTPHSFPDVAALDLLENPSGLRWADLVVGTGTLIVRGSNADMHYTGWLPDGERFDSSVDRGETFPLEDVGDAPVIEGWNEGLVGMRAGGRRVLVIPPDLAYGPDGIPGAIPPAATLVFVVDAVTVTSG